MEKTRRIKKLVNKLQLDRNGWYIQDYWDSDLAAIGIASRERPHNLVYINTFGKVRGLYYYDCEVNHETDDYKVVDRGDNVTFDELLAIINKHLGKATE